MDHNSEARARVGELRMCRHRLGLAVECIKSPALDWLRPFAHLWAGGVKHRGLAWCGGPVAAFRVAALEVRHFATRLSEFTNWQ